MIKNLHEKLTVDEYNHEYLLKNWQEGGRLKVFKEVFLGKMGAMSKANWIMLLFCLPAIAVVFYTMWRSFNFALYTPFSSNFGLGYPVVDNAEEIYSGLMFQNNLFRALLLIPCIIIGCVGLSGAFNVIKYESLGFDVKVWKTFFKGVKNNFVAYMWIGLINALMFFLLELAINQYGITDMHLAVKIVAITVTAIVMAFVLIISFYVLAQASLYDLPLIKLIKNAFWLTVAVPLQNIIILAFSSIPVVLLCVMGTSYILQLIVIMLCAMLGISYIVCIWTIYSHYVFSLAFSAPTDKAAVKAETIVEAKEKQAASDEKKAAYDEKKKNRAKQNSNNSNAESNAVSVKANSQSNSQTHSVNKQNNYGNSQKNRHKSSHGKGKGNNGGKPRIK